MTQTLKALVFIADDLGSVANTQMALNKNSVTPSLDDLTHSSSGDTRYTCGMHTYKQTKHSYTWNRVNKSKSLNVTLLISH